MKTPANVTLIRDVGMGLLVAVVALVGRHLH